MKRFINTSGHDLIIYADSHMTRRVGLLYPNSACLCIHEQAGGVVVLYKVRAGGVLKVGFTDYAEGVRE